jgi:hypothetical protein
VVTGVLDPPPEPVPALAPLEWVTTGDVCPAECELPPEGEPEPLPLVDVVTGIDSVDEGEEDPPPTEEDPVVALAVPAVPP